MPSNLPPLNWLVSPTSSLEPSPQNPSINSTSHEQLTQPIPHDELSKQLELWANVKFAFDSPDNNNGGQLIDDNIFDDKWDRTKFSKRQKYDFDQSFINVQQSSIDPFESFDLLSKSNVQQPASLASNTSNTTLPSASQLVNEAVDEENDEDKVIRRRRFKKLPMPPIKPVEGETYEQARIRIEMEHKEAEDSAKKELEEDKRRRNTAASARFRVKKKAREAALEQSANEYKSKVESLEKEVDDLKRENGWLRGLIIGSNSATHQNEPQNTI